jgi:hypothetical protein
MPESFLHLKAQEQSQIYRALAPQLARFTLIALLGIYSDQP